MGNLLRSHPPIETRIRRLEPDWDEVLPIVLPAHAARMDTSDNDNVIVADGPSALTTSAREAAAGMQPPARAQMLAAGL